MEQLENIVQSEQLFHIFSAIAVQAYNKQGSHNLENIQILKISSLSLEQAKIINSRCHNLKSLYVNFKCPPDVLQIITNIKTLESIQLCIQQAYPRPFLNLQNLIHIDITILDVENIPFPNLKSFKYVQSISLEIILKLKQFKSLQDLSFNKVQIDLEMMGVMTKELSSLTGFHFYNCNLTDKHIEIMTTNIPQITRLTLLNSEVTVNGLKYLKVYQNSMQKFSQNYNCNINSSLYKFIVQNFKSLKELEIKGVDLSFLQFLQPPQSLEKISIEGCNEKSVLASVNKFLNNKYLLKRLDIRRSYNLETIKIVSQNYKQLSTLKLSGMNQFNNTGCFYVSILRKLKSVYMKYSFLSDVGIMKIVRNIVQANCSLTDNHALFNRNFKSITNKCKKNLRVLNFTRQMKISE